MRRNAFFLHKTVTLKDIKVFYIGKNKQTIFNCSEDNIYLNNSDKPFVKRKISTLKDLKVVCIQKKIS